MDGLLSYDKIKSPELDSLLVLIIWWVGNLRHNSVSNIFSDRIPLLLELRNLLEILLRVICVSSIVFLIVLNS